jgi:uncharacterized membrane protein YgcG
MRVLPFVALPLLFACNGEQDSSLAREVGACGQTETHVIGVYDPGGDGGGDATVYIERPGKHALVVSAHAATTWHITVKPGAELVHVYAVGYHHQAVDAPPGTDIVTESHDDGTADATGYEWPNADTRHLLSLAADRVHHKATSFHGCHTAAAWTIGENMVVNSDCDTASGYAQVDAVLDCDGGGTTCGSGSGSGSGSGGGSGSGSGSGTGSGSGLF